MNTELYDKWIMSHQIEESEVDLTDVVMTQIAGKTHRPNILKQTWHGILQDLMQTRVLVRTCVLASGVLMGLIRMVFQVYSVLFT